MFKRAAHHTIMLLPITIAWILLVNGTIAMQAFAGFLAPQRPAATCKQHDFGNPGLQLYVYSDGRAWSFTAETSMQIASIETKSILASNSGTFHIQVKINGDVVASWSQYVNSTYTPYYHLAGVDLSLNAGDTITYFIYNGTMSTPAGGITGVNYVELCEP